MANTRKEKPTTEKVEDEPGADQRFTNILKRALNTPPKRKQGAPKPRKAKK